MKIKQLMLSATIAIVLPLVAATASASTVKQKGEASISYAKFQSERKEGRKGYDCFGVWMKSKADCEMVYGTPN